MREPDRGLKEYGFDMLFTTIKLSSKYNKGLDAKLQIKRRKIAILKLFQANLHSPFFWKKNKQIYLFICF
jgi:hypothetical protein